MERKELLKRVGNMQQEAYLRPQRLMEGRGRGMEIYDVKNGRLQFKVMADKCLDLAELSYRGENVSFLSKPGLSGRNHYDTNGGEALRSIMGGMLFTCGLENICAPCTVDGKEYPMHGRIRTTPAEHVSKKAQWEDEGYVMEISGEMREAELFGENLVLKRTIRTVYPQQSITITDEITNEAFREEPMMLLYHFNVGYPMLSEDSEILIPSRKVIPRDEDAKRGLERWNIAESPVDNQPEAVFLHELSADEAGNTFAAVWNKKLGFGLKISWNQRNLPYFMEWKSLGSGDYVLGLEPANSSVYGKKYHLERGDHPEIGAFETIKNELKLEIIEDRETIIEAMNRKTGKRREPNTLHFHDRKE